MSDRRPHHFWSDLPRPIWALAPMEDVTDTVLRRLLRRWSPGGGPAVMFTEFTRVDTPMRVLAGSRPGRLRYSSEERPIVAQLWGTRPDEFFRAAGALEALGFDGIDINLGCPVRKIRAAGACSALIRDRGLTAEIISATTAGSSLPVSVKTRIGFDKVETDAWCGFLLSQGLAALTVHGRTALQMSEGWADWREIGRVVRMRDSIAPGTVVIGNGDVRSLAHATRLVEQVNVDGVMFGRGIFSDPLLFGRMTDHAAGVSPNGIEIPSWAHEPLTVRLGYLKEHILEWDAVWGDQRNWEILKKFFKNYVTPPGFLHAPERDYVRGATDLLDELYQTRAIPDALALIAGFRAKAA